jgi:hypothetical protein
MVVLGPLTMLTGLKQKVPETKKGDWDMEYINYLFDNLNIQLFFTGFFFDC